MLLSSSDQEYAVPFNGTEIWMNCKDIYFHIKWMMKDERWKPLWLGESARFSHSVLELGREGCLNKCISCGKVILDCPFGTLPKVRLGKVPKSTWEGPWGCPCSGLWCSSPVSLRLAVQLPLLSGVQRAERRRYDQKWGPPSLKMLSHILFRLLLFLLAQSCMAPLEIRRGFLWKNTENSKWDHQKIILQ